MMLFNGLFWLLILGHIVGEFYLQPAMLYAKRRKSGGFRLLHTLVYAGVILAALVPILFARGAKVSYIYLVLAVAGMHALVVWIGDWWTARYARGNPSRERWFFWITQAMQLASIMAATLVFRQEVGRTLLSNAGRQIRDLLVFYIFNEGYQSIRALSILQIVCMFLLLAKPANAAMGTFVLEEGPLDRGERIVGIAERWIIATLMLTHNYVAIPLVVIAKSVLCWHQCAGEKNAARRMLVLTFVSVVAAILIVLFCGPVPEVSLNVLSPNG